MTEYVLSTRIPVEDVIATYRKRHTAVDKIQGLFVDSEENRAARARIRARLPQVVVTGALTNNIEANAEGAKKGIALLKFGEQMGIRPEEIMVCGDSSNDMDMIARAGLSVAMGNSVPEIREAADYVTASNDEDGVAKAIEKFVL